MENLIKPTQSKWSAPNKAIKSSLFMLDDSTYSCFVDSTTQGTKPCLTFGFSKEEAEENAQIIARSVNNHNELLEALAKILFTYKHVDEKDLTRAEKQIISISQNAIKKATEE